MALFRKMALEVPKAWTSVTAQAEAELALSAKELALVEAITRVIEGNCAAAVSMTE